MNCPKCNSNIEQEKSFCTTCGWNLIQTTTKNNQGTMNIVKNNYNEESIKTTIIKYLIKCYIPFLIIFYIYMATNNNIQQCVNDTTDSTLPCTIMYFLSEILFIITNFIIVLPFIISSTKKLLNKFNTKETKLKIVDLIFIILTSITSVFLTNKINVLSFFLIPIMTLLYFTKDDISKKASKTIYFVVISSLLITSILTGYVFYKVIITYNIAVIPLISIIFYLLNQNKINFKIHKLIPTVLVSILLVFSSYQFLLKDNKSFSETVEKENINFKYEDINYLNDLVYANDEKIYIISSEGNYYNDTKYLSKYNINNNEFEILFSNIKNAVIGDDLIFFNKSNNIYMLNTKNDEVKKIIDKKYYGNTYHYMYYDSGNLYFSSDNIVYSYTVNNSTINSFTIDKGEEIQGIFNNSIITEFYDYYSSHYSYDYSGKKVKLTKLPSYFSIDLEDTFIYQNYLYYFNNEYMNNTIIINNLNKSQAFEYKINLNDIYYDETQQTYIDRITFINFLGVYDNNIYIKISYDIKNNNSNTKNNSSKIYYFHISDYEKTNNIKLNKLNTTIKIGSAYFLDNYIYIKDNNNNNNIIYKYNLENNIIIHKNSAEDCYLDVSSNNYIYCTETYSGNIYRINKNDLRIKKILE